MKKYFVIPFLMIALALGFFAGTAIINPAPAEAASRGAIITNSSESKVAFKVCKDIVNGNCDPQFQQYLLRPGQKTLAPFYGVYIGPGCDALAKNQFQPVKWLRKTGWHTFKSSSWTIRVYC